MAFDLDDVELASTRKLYGLDKKKNVLVSKENQKKIKKSSGIRKEENENG